MHMQQPSATLRILLKEYCDAKGLPEPWIRRFADKYEHVSPDFLATSGAVTWSSLQIPCRLMSVRG
jgi:hypothetical protein